MNDELVSAIDEHLKKLREAATQPLAIAWMKQAYELLRMCANELEKPKVITFASPESKILPASGFKSPPPIWFQGKTVVYKQPKAWTRKDTDKLVKANRSKV